MKKRMIQKLLTTTATFLACSLLIGNIPIPTPTDEDGDTIFIEIPDSDDKDDENSCSPLGDEKPWGVPGE